MAGYWELRQQLQTLYNFYDLQSIIFTAPSLPIRSEWLTARGTNGASINQPIVTDFIPQLNNDRSNFTYNANPYRLIDCLGNTEIKRFDFRVCYSNKAGEIKPLMLQPRQGMSVKFAFILRSVNFL